MLLLAILSDQSVSKEIVRVSGRSYNKEYLFYKKMKLLKVN